MTESAAALVFAEPSGVIRIWNSAAESLFGHRAAEAIGQTLDLIVPPDYRGRHWEGYRAAMAAADGNIDHSSFDIPALRRDGTIIRRRGQAARGPRQPKPGGRRHGRLRGGR